MNENDDGTGRRGQYGKGVHDGDFNESPTGDFGGKSTVCVTAEATDFDTNGNHGYDLLTYPGDTQSYYSTMVRSIRFLLCVLVHQHYGNNDQYPVKEHTDL